MMRSLKELAQRTEAQRRRRGTSTAAIKAKARKQVARGTLRYIRSLPGGGAFLRGLSASDLVVPEISSALRNWLSEHDKRGLNPDTAELSTVARLILPVDGANPAPKRGKYDGLGQEHYVHPRPVVESDDPIERALQHVERMRRIDTEVNAIVERLIGLLRGHPLAVVGDNRTVLLRRSLRKMEPTALVADAARRFSADDILDIVDSVSRLYRTATAGVADEARREEEIRAWQARILKDVLNAVRYV